MAWVALLVVGLLALGLVVASHVMDREREEAGNSAAEPGGERTAFDVGYSIRPLEQPGGDAVPMSVWYPAADRSEATRLTLRDYYLLGDTADGAGRLAQVEEAARAQGVDRQRFLEALDLRRTARADPAPASGSFPVVAFSPGNGGPPFHAFELCEHLASRGIIVVAVPSRKWLGDDSTGAEAMERAAEELWHAAQAGLALPHGDPERLGVMGYSLGGTIATLLAMKHPQVDAVVALDPGFRVEGNYDTMARASGFDPGRLTQPVLLVHARGVKHVPDRRLVMAAPAAWWILSFPELRHGDLSSLVRELFIVPTWPQGNEYPDRVAAGHRAVTRYAASFLLAHLADRQDARDFLSAKPTDHGIPEGVVVQESRSPGSPGSSRRSSR